MEYGKPRHFGLCFIQDFFLFTGLPGPQQFNSASANPMPARIELERALWNNTVFRFVLHNFGSHFSAVDAADWRLSLIMRSEQQSQFRIDRPVAGLGLIVATSRCDAPYGCSTVECVREERYAVLGEVDLRRQTWAT